MSVVSQTLYVNHICDKIGTNELKRALFSIFSAYGTILEIRAHKGLKRRGQAWITFQSTDSAVAAKRMLDKYYLFDRPISVNFALAKSQITQKMSGTFNPYGRKAERISDAEAEFLTHGSIPKYYDFDMLSEDEEEIIITEEPAYSKPIPVIAPTADLNPPNKTLFVQNLPDSDNKLLLSMLFQQYLGFVEARTVPKKNDIAFVEFDTIDQATAALNGLNGMTIDDEHHMLIQYAKQ
ncbi:U1 small nuclear ribonucleoprotein A [Histomonas meleagridis]|uniref:U1 small nuclear ribonucleoprotein A n=1 Tax=Histomonas meleagridis TaxID=135588 RepID=UPI00355A9B7A|nr:U1 small nuclear ribonucleoprotein A [Histomonas meleagridis]KAH0803948.1 U1 small nuclear ribonucleoprotein A [Histomonas meleagridis]